MDIKEKSAYAVTVLLGLILGYIVAALADSIISKKKFKLRPGFYEVKKTLSVAVMVLNAALYVILTVFKGIGVETVLYCVFTSALLLLSIIDFKTYEIPFGINVFIFSMGVLRFVLDLTRLCAYSVGHWYDYIIGFFAVSLFLYLIVLATKGRGMGGGDVKLMAAAGLVTGWQLAWVGFIFGCVLGSVIHVIRMRVSKSDDPVLAFGPYLSLGLYLSVVWGWDFIYWYLRMCHVKGY